MRDVRPESEAHYVRDCVTRDLDALGFRRVTDSVQAIDGWRGEFLGGDDKEVVVLTHKPGDGGFVTFETTITMDRPDDAERLHDIVETTSDYDVSFYFSDATRRPCCHLASRLYLASLNTGEMTYCVENLLHCRTAVEDIG